MDQYHEDSKSDEDSITLELQGSDAVIVYGCNEHSRPTYVTRVLLGPGVPSSSVDDTVINNSAPAESALEHCSQQTKPYNELAEAVARIGGKSLKTSSIPVPPDLTREFRNSARYLNPPSKTNIDPIAPTNGSLELPHNSDVVVNVPATVNQQPTSLTVIAINADPPAPTHPPDLLGLASRAAVPAEPQPNNPVADETVPKDTVSPYSTDRKISSTKVTESDGHNSNSAGEAGEVNALPAQSFPEPTKIQIVNACSEKIPLQQSAKAESSFHTTDPQKPKEVKFDEPPKQVGLTLEEFSEKLGEIVPITIQTGQNAAKAVEPVETPQPVSATQCKSKEEPGDRRTTSNHANGNTKTNNFREQEAESSGEVEEQEHSYEIENEDNMSEITLPPVLDSNIHQIHDIGPINGHPCHRIRISIDQQSASPSRKTMAITGVIVVLLLLAAILFGVYKFFHKRPSD